MSSLLVSSHHSWVRPWRCNSVIFDSLPVVFIWTFLRLKMVFDEYPTRWIKDFKILSYAWAKEQKYIYRLKQEEKCKVDWPLALASHGISIISISTCGSGGRMPPALLLCTNHSHSPLLSPLCILPRIPRITMRYPFHWYVGNLYAFDRESIWKQFDFWRRRSWWHRRLVWGWVCVHEWEMIYLVVSRPVEEKGYR